MLFHMHKATTMYMNVRENVRGETVAQ